MKRLPSTHLSTAIVGRGGRSTPLTAWMRNCREPYPSDASPEEWLPIAPYLLLQREGAGQREHDPRERFDGLRYIVETGIPWR